MKKLSDYINVNDYCEGEQNYLIPAVNIVKPLRRKDCFLNIKNIRILAKRCVLIE